MRFAHDVHRVTFDRVEEYLGELFDDPFHDPATDHFYVRYGSTVLEVGVEPYGPEDAVVSVMAYLAQDVEIDDALKTGLLALNHELPIGHFSIVGRDVYFSHSFFGHGLDRESLLSCLAGVANLADDYDDKIVAQYGGATALERIRSTGGRQRRRQETRLDDE